MRCQYGVNLIQNQINKNTACSLEEIVKQLLPPYFYSKTNKMHQCIKFVLFWNDTLHVSDGLSIHHQEFNSAHTVAVSV